MSIDRDEHKQEESAENSGGGSRGSSGGGGSSLEHEPTGDLFPSDDGDEPIPAQLGRYRVLRKIGAGGMGIVYEARQEHPSRRVALKVIRPAFASSSLLRRFDFEVQVLGQLEHPGIARIYEAGTAQDGSRTHPFFAMEYVGGPPITEYVKSRNLTLSQRLELMARVCDAVQHAHQKGVIHRDLKPANILVQVEDDEASGTDHAAPAGAGRPKVLDFGVACVADRDREESTVQTVAGQLLGTIPYMSPEQIRGAGGLVDTRTDVYSLGVVLYEMLSGELPHELKGKGLVDAARIVNDREAAPISTHDNACRGDVNTIVAKALAKEPDHRYDSAAQFGADIRRFLRHEPILARPASLIYQFRRFARRHQALVGGASLAIIGLVVGLVLAVSYAVDAENQAEYADAQRVLAQQERAIAQDEREVAQQERAIAQTQREVADEQREIAQQERDAALASTQHAEAANLFLKDMLSAADPMRTPDRDITMVEVLNTAALTMRESFTDHPAIELMVLDTLGSTYKHLGRMDEAEQHFLRALDVAIDLHGEDDVQAYNARTNLALVYIEQGRLDEALRLAQAAHDGLERAVGPDDVSALVARHNLGLVHSAMGRYALAEPLIEYAVDGVQRLRGESHPQSLRMLMSLCSVYGSSGRESDALERYEEAVRISAEQEYPDHPVTMMCRNNLAQLYQQQGEFDLAEPLMVHLVESGRRVLGSEHRNTLAFLNNLGGLYYTQGRYEEAAPLYVESLDVSRATLGPTHPDTLRAANNLAGNYERTGQIELAEPLYVDVLAARRETLGDDHPETLTSVNNLAYFYRNQERYEDALPLLHDAIDGFTRSLGAGHPNTLVAMSNLGVVYNRTERFGPAEELHAMTLKRIAGKVPPDHWLIGLMTVRHGVSLAGLGRHDEAEAKLLDGQHMLESALSLEHDRTITAIRALISFYESQDRVEDAAAWEARLPAAEPAS